MRWDAIKEVLQMTQLSEKHYSHHLTGKEPVGTVNVGLNSY
jgi:hypothetical protein